MRVVEISCWIPAAGTPATADPLVSLLADIAPDFVPRRYGNGDPAPHKADRDGHGFAAYWTDKVAQGGIISWRGRPPALHASIFLPSPHPAAPPSRECARLLLDADTERFPAMQAAALLSGLGSRFGCIYGSAWVLDGYRFRGGTLIWNLGGDEADEAHGSTWIGLPPTSPWLAWYGRAYAALVARAVDGRPTGGGILAGHPERYAEPSRYASAAEAAKGGTYLPAELLARRKDARFWAVPPSIPAALIPQDG